MLVQMVDIGMSKQIVVELEKNVNVLMKSVEERDYEIAQTFVINYNNKRKTIL